MLSAALIALPSCKTAPEYDATGIFEAETVTISAETAGTLLQFPVEEGDSLNAGELSAMVDSTILVLQKAQLQSQQTSIAASTPDIAAQIAALNAQIDHQTNECNRQSRLLADGATTQKLYDDAQSQLHVLKAQLTALRSSLGKNVTSTSDNSDAIKWQIGQTQEQIAKCSIKAPITGTVLTKYAQAGEYVTPGRPLFQMADLNAIYLRAYFTASQLADLQIGQQVTVTADFGNNILFDYPGTITWIAQQSEFTPKSIQTADSRANLVYAVKISVRNDGRLKLGQYGEVKL